MEIVCLTVDCADPPEVAEFWNDALGWGGVAAALDGSGAICGPSAGGVYLEFIRVPEAKTIKNRVHLGCSAGTLEQLEAELARLETIGASIVWEEAFPPDIAASYRNVILRDVEGNEFCLSGGLLPDGDG